LGRLLRGQPWRQERKIVAGGTPGVKPWCRALP